MEPPSEFVQPVVPYLLRDSDLQAALANSLDEDYWRQLTPGLTLTDEPFDKGAGPFAVDGSELETAIHTLVKDGYFRLAPIIPCSVLEPIARAISDLVRNGLHPVFSMMYDEPWAMLARLGNLLEPILGPSPLMIPEYWVWQVGAGADPSGWGPHRDLQYRGRVVLRADGRPTLLTIWIPYTDATSENSCISVLPLSRDPAYPDHIHGRRVPAGSECELAAVRGSVLGWNQYVLHWGSQLNSSAPSPRISIGIYFQSSDVDPYGPLARPLRGAMPLSDRLAYAGQTILRYAGDFAFPPSLIANARGWRSLLE